jgi:hypothetical protein
MASTYRAGEVLLTLPQLAPIAGFFIRSHLLESSITPPQTPTLISQTGTPLRRAISSNQPSVKGLKDEYDQDV